MLAEAQKYIGYPYVWGGSSPATSFDCSGYVSWVINHSGWNVGRLGAQGPVSYTHMMRNVRDWRKSRLSGAIKSFVPSPVCGMSFHEKRNASRLPGCIWL